jgi:hypothetical protein
MPTVAVKLSFTSKTNVEVVYGGNRVIPFHHLLTATVLTSSAAPKYPRRTCKALPLSTHTARPANCPSLPVSFPYVNRIFKFFFFYPYPYSYLFYPTFHRLSITKTRTFIIKFYFSPPPIPLGFPLKCPPRGSRDHRFSPLPVVFNGGPSLWTPAGKPPAPIFQAS